MTVNKIEVNAYYPMLVVKDTRSNYFIPLPTFVGNCVVSNPPWSSVPRYNPGGISRISDIIKPTQVGWKNVVRNFVPGELGKQLQDMSDRAWNNRKDVPCSWVLQEGCHKSLLEISALTTTVIRLLHWSPIAAQLYSAWSEQKEHWCYQPQSDIERCMLGCVMQPLPL